MSDNPTFVQALADATQRPSRSARSPRPPPSAPATSPVWPSARGSTRRHRRAVAPAAVSSRPRTLDRAMGGDRGAGERLVPELPPWSSDTRTCRAGLSGSHVLELLGLPPAGKAGATSRIDAERTPARAHNRRSIRRGRHRRLADDFGRRVAGSVLGRVRRAARQRAPVAVAATSTPTDDRRHASASTPRRRPARPAPPPTHDRRLPAAPTATDADAARVPPDGRDGARRSSTPAPRSSTGSTTRRPSTVRVAPASTTWPTRRASPAARQGRRQRRRTRRSIAEFEDALQGPDDRMAGQALEDSPVATHLDAHRHSSKASTPPSCSRRSSSPRADTSPRWPPSPGATPTRLRRLRPRAPATRSPPTTTRLQPERISSGPPGRRPSPILTNGTNRRRFIQAGGVTAAGAAVLAACSTDGQPAQRDRHRPRDDDAAEAPVNDVTLLRTSTSLEYLLIVGVRPRRRAELLEPPSTAIAAKMRAITRPTPSTFDELTDRSRRRPCDVRQRADVRAPYFEPALVDPRQHAGAPLGITDENPPPADDPNGDTMALLTRWSDRRPPRSSPTCRPQRHRRCASAGSRSASPRSPRRMWGALINPELVDATLLPTAGGRAVADDHGDRADRPTAVARRRRRAAATDAADNRRSRSVRGSRRCRLRSSSCSAVPIELGAPTRTACARDQHGDAEPQHADLRRTCGTCRRACSSPYTAPTVSRPGGRGTSFVSRVEESRDSTEQGAGESQVGAT